MKNAPMPVFPVLHEKLHGQSLRRFQDFSPTEKMCPYLQTGLPSNAHSTQQKDKLSLPKKKETKKSVKKKYFRDRDLGKNMRRRGRHQFDYSCREQPRTWQNGQFIPTCLSLSNQDILLFMTWSNERGKETWSENSFISISVASKQPCWQEKERERK